MTRLLVFFAMFLGGNVFAEDLYIARDDAPSLTWMTDVDPEQLEIDHWEAWCFRDSGGTRIRWGVIVAATLPELNKAIADRQQTDADYERHYRRLPALNYRDLQSPIARLRHERRKPLSPSSKLLNRLTKLRQTLSNNVGRLTRAERLEIPDLLKVAAELDLLEKGIAESIQSGAQLRRFDEPLTELEHELVREQTPGALLPRESKSRTTNCCLPERVLSSCNEQEAAVDCLGFDQPTLPSGCSSKGDGEFCCVLPVLGPKCP